MSNNRRTLVIVVSAPSGAGKTTIGNRLLAEFKKMARSVSCTSRDKRRGEVNGKDYHFVSEEEFESRLQRKEFLEHAVVHGKRYGTLRKPVEKMLASGHDVLMAIDVQGARQVRQSAATAPDDSLLKRGLIDIFVMPPSLQVLQKRLVARNDDKPEDIARRMKNAKKEMKCLHEFKYRVVNDDLDAAVDDIRSIIKAEHCRIRNDA